MARRPTKAADNPFCKARLEAAKYNEKFFSKEYAAEQLHISQDNFKIMSLASQSAYRQTAS